MESKREKILNAAMKLFNERGFHATPTSLIAKEAGVSVGTLFNTFETKEVLIKELYIDVKKRSKEYFMDHLNTELRELDLFKDMWKNIIHWNLENPEAFQFIGQFSHSPYINKLDHDVESYKKMRDFVLGFLTNKEICKKYPNFSFKYLNSIVTSTTEYIKNNDIEDCDEFIAMTFDLFWKGFGPTE